MIVVSLADKTSEIAKLLDTFGEKQFKNLAKSIRKSVNMVGKEWKRRVMSSNAKEGWKTIYAASIFPDETRDFLKASFSAQGMYVNFVENGVKSFDMKIGLLNSRRAKTNKKGEKYLRIFMRKKLKSLPPDIKQAAMNLDYKESIEGFENIGKKTNLKNKYSTKTGVYQGLTKLGEPRHSQYGTFRVVTEKSKGWLYPGASSHKIFRTLRNMAPRIKKELQKGLAKDLEIITG